MRYGLIAGNGKFPLLVARRRAARRRLSLGRAIHEETDPQIESLADRVEWVGIGQLGKMIRFFKRRGSGKGNHGRTGQTRSDFQPRRSRRPHVKNAFETAASQHRFTDRSSR